MQIINAQSIHSDYISSSLVQEYIEANQKFGYPRYKEDYDLMFKHVSKRIEEGNPFVYFVALDGDIPVGFANLMIDENNIGSFLIVRGDSKQVKEALIMKSMEFFREKGVSKIIGELMYDDEDCISIFEGLGLNKVMFSFNLNLY